MQADYKNKNQDSNRKNVRLGLVLVIVFFLTILLINISWLFYLLLGEGYWLLAALSVLASIFLFVLAILQHKKIISLSGEPKTSFDNFRQEQKSSDSLSGENEKELLKAQEELRKMKEEFLKTTQDLFQRETELVQANKKIQELDAIKSEFVSVAAHQLRTPLTGIKWSYLALLEKNTGPLNPEQKKIAEEGLEAIDYAIDTTNDLLNTARLEEGKSTVNPEEQPIGPVIEEILKQHEPVIKEKKIKTNIDFPFSSPLSLKFDKEKISIVFDNIIANAVKYTPEGGTLELKVFREKDKIIFKIKDSGIGIPKAELEKVFSKFFRAKNAVSFQTSGSGLGLYVAKSIIEKHGGNISLESEEKSGTTVTFSLPIK